MFEPEMHYIYYYGFAAGMVIAASRLSHAVSLFHPP